MYAKRILNHFRLLFLKHYLPEQNWAFHFLLNEKWDAKFFREYFRAIKFKIDSWNNYFYRVFIFSYPRSGTHNFYTRFHYLPCCFAMGENNFSLPLRDPYQFIIKVSRIRAVHFLFSSVFLEQGLQEKNGKDLSHILFLNNRYLKYNQSIEVEKLKKNCDFIIFYFRNFVRTLYSQDKGGRKAGKPHFIMNEANFIKAVQNHRRNLNEMLHLINTKLDVCKFVSHEIFCANPTKAFNDICDFINIEANQRYGWNKPQDFFQRCYRTSEKPEIYNNKLFCKYRKRMILGKGGNYNPLPEISLDRTMSDPIWKWIDKERYELLKTSFGEELVDFWINDSNFNYKDANNQDIINIIQNSILSTKKSNL